MEKALESRAEEAVSAKEALPATGRPSGVSDRESYERHASGHIAVSTADFAGTGRAVVADQKRVESRLNRCPPCRDGERLYEEDQRPPKCAKESSEGRQCGGEGGGDNYATFHACPQLNRGLFENGGEGAHGTDLMARCEHPIASCLRPEPDETHDSGFPEALCTRLAA